MAAGAVAVPAAKPPRAIEQADAAASRVRDPTNNEGE
jgi:hypothetical protein